MQIESEGMVETRRLEYIEWTCEGGSNRHPGVMQGRQGCKQDGAQGSCKAGKVKAAGRPEMKLCADYAQVISQMAAEGDFVAVERQERCLSSYRRKANPLSTGGA